MRKIYLMMMVCGCMGTALSQVTVEKTALQMGLAVTPATGTDAAQAKSAQEILEKDLQRCGWFALVTLNAAEATVQTRVEIQGGVFTLDGWVTKPDKSQTLARRYQGGNLRALVHQWADAIVEAVAKQKGIAQSKIAFISKKSGSTEVWMMDYDGENPEQLTQDKAICGHPRWSMDRKQIAVTSYRKIYPDVYLLDLMARSLRRVAGFPGLNTGAAFSADGLLALTLSKEGNPEVYTMDVDGGHLRRLTNTPTEESSPSWSPDGKRIVFDATTSGSPQLWVMAREGGEAERLVTKINYCTEPDWSPRGDAIAFVGRVGGGFQIFALDLQIGQVLQLTNTGGDNMNPSWAPDGRHLVFERRMAGSSALYVLDAVTGQAVRVGEKLSDCAEPAWSR